VLSLTVVSCPCISSEKCGEERDLIVICPVNERGRCSVIFPFVVDKDRDKGGLGTGRASEIWPLTLPFVEVISTSMGRVLIFFSSPPFLVVSNSSRTSIAPLVDCKNTFFLLCSVSPGLIGDNSAAGSLRNGSMIYVPRMEELVRQSDRWFVGLGRG
jgi:hypothetical protein